MNLEQSPWYKNPYLWLVIALPASAVIAGIATVIITSMNQPDMVVDDYYKKGKAINLELKLYDKAKAKNIEFLVIIDSNKIVLNNANNLPAVKINFVHSTLEHRDLNVIATPNAKGQLTALLDDDMNGKWQLFVEPMDGSWKVRTELALPNKSSFILN